MIRFILFCILLLSAFSITAEERIIYEYKKYERFDLGSLEVKGEVIAPGDISVRERERKNFEVNLFERKEMDSFRRKDLEHIR